MLTFLSKPSRHWGKAPGPSGMGTDHLKSWLTMSEREINPDRFLWDQLVWLVQHVWASGTLLTQLPWAILVLLPKSNGGPRGIGLLEVIWKVVSSILDG